MAELMSLKTWMDQTNAGFFSVRSGTLKSVDQALGQYHTSSKSPADLERLQKALTAWINEKGPRWKTSPRNRFGAVETLLQQVMNLPVEYSLQDLGMIGILKEEEEAIMPKLFRGKQLISRHIYLARLRAEFKAAKGQPSPNPNSRYVDGDPERGFNRRFLPR